MRLGSTTAFIFGVAGVISGPASAAPNPLASYRGTARVLVLSASDAGDPYIARQRGELTVVQAGSADRDLILVEAVGDDPEAKAALRNRLGLPPEGFGVVLVGKDGGVKISSNAPITPQRLFSTIDAMPMRRDEMIRHR